MTTIKETAEEIINMVIELYQSGLSVKHNSVGLRGLYDGEDLGEMENSWCWDDGEQTDWKLDGTCALQVCGDIDELINWDEDGDVRANVIKNIEYALANINSYGESMVGLVFGRSSYGGDDIGEVVLSDAECVKVWK